MNMYDFKEERKVKNIIFSGFFTESLFRRHCPYELSVIAKMAHADKQLKHVQFHVVISPTVLDEPDEELLVEIYNLVDLYNQTKQPDRISTIEMKRER